MLRPLFIPLKREFFLQFTAGLKTTEYRAYGSTWNAAVCTVGRKVVISLGYGKQARRTGTITYFACIKRRMVPRHITLPFPGNHRQLIAQIEIKLDPPPPITENEQN